MEKPITGVSVKADKSELKVGETAKLTAVITPEDTTDSKDLKYESPSYSKLIFFEGLFLLVIGID